MNKYETTSKLPSGTEVPKKLVPSVLGGIKCECILPNTKEEMHKFFDDVCHRVAKREIPRAVNLLKSIR